MQSVFLVLPPLVDLLLFPVLLRADDGRHTQLAAHSRVPSLEIAGFGGVGRRAGLVEFLFAFLLKCSS